MLTRQLRFDRAADQARAFAENRDGHFIGGRGGIEQLFLRKPAVVPERLELEAIDFRTARRKLRRHGVGQREIDIIAAEQNVIAHRNAIERQLSVTARRPRSA